VLYIRSFRTSKHTRAIRDAYTVFLCHFPPHRRTTLSKKTFIPLLLLTLLILSGCAASSIGTAESKGAKALNAEEIFDLVNDNTLHMVASDFDAHVYCRQDGTLAAQALLNSVTDDGGWDIKNDDKLCLKFTAWYYGDVTCSSVYQEAETNQYLLFTNNGALAFTVTVSTGNSQNIKIKSLKEKDETFLRSSIKEDQGGSYAHPAAATAALPDPITSSGPGASSEEIRHTIKSMAKDCPGCNFKEADLRKADLIAANLQEANLRRADLSRANLRRANLEGADLSGATLLSTNLPGANLKDADLTGADLTGSNLIHADFTGATLDNIILENTLQEGVKGLKR
jgi:Pentapeptide repeats (8 copies)